VTDNLGSVAEGLFNFLEPALLQVDRYILPSHKKLVRNVVQLFFQFDDFFFAQFSERELLESRLLVYAVEAQVKGIPFF
jgi:hypothetical protein